MSVRQAALILWFAGTLGVLAGCSSESSDKAPAAQVPAASGSQLGGDPVTVPSEGGSGGADASDGQTLGNAPAKTDISSLLPTGPLVQATYLVNVTALGGISVCSGSATMVINGDMTVTIPNATMSCGLGLCTVDLAGILSSMTKSTVDPSKLLSTLKAGQKVMTIEQIGDGTFAPARDILISPFSIKPKDLLGFSHVYSGQLSTQGGAHASGTITTKVLSATDTTIDWSMTATGWDGVPRVKYALLKELEVEWSLRPVGIPKIVITSEVGDMLAATDQQAGSPSDLVKLCSGSSGQILGALTNFAEGVPIISSITNTLFQASKGLDATSTITQQSITPLNNIATGTSTP